MILLSFDNLGIWIRIKVLKFASWARCCGTACNPIIQEAEAGGLIPSTLGGSDVKLDPFMLQKGWFVTQE